MTSNRWTRPLLPIPQGMGSLRLRLGGIALLCALAAADAVRAWIMTRAMGIPTPFYREVFIAVLWWFFWIPIVPLAFGLARRFDLTRPPRGRAAAVHLLAGTLISVLHLTALTLVAWFAWLAARGEGIVALQRNLTMIVGSYIVYEVVCYAMAVAAFYIIRARSDAEEARVREARYREEAARAEAREVEARLSALRMELNPHFLFNVLNDTSALIRTDRGPAATTMLARLAELLRLTLRPPREREVPLDAEMELLEHYLDIERLRFGDRLRVEIDIPESLGGVAVPPFLLQPLVENALHHGLGPSQDLFSVSIAARGGFGETLELVVEDDGPGFAGAPRAGVGLTNIERRLEAMYGDEGRLDLGNRPGGGARVTIRLPARPVGVEMVAAPGGIR